MPTYLKMLRADGTSLNGKHKYTLPADGQEGEWQNVPGNGCYLAEWRDSELFGGGMGDVLWEVEAEREVCKSDVQGVRYCSPIRLVRRLDWSKLVDSEHAYLALCYCKGLTEAQVEALIGRIDWSEHVYWALCYRKRLTEAQVDALVRRIDQSEDAYMAIRECTRLTEEQRQRLQTMRMAVESTSALGGAL